MDALLYYELIDDADMKILSSREGLSNVEVSLGGLYRPPSILCSGTGRPVCSINPGTVPTTEHVMYGDWLTSLLK